MLKVFPLSFSAYVF